MTMMRLRSIVVVALAFMPTVVQGEMFYLHNLLNDKKDSAPYVQNEHGQRFLKFQSSLNNNTCATDPSDDSRYTCTVETTMKSASTNDQVYINATVGCPAADNFDFQATPSACECSASITNVQTGDLTSCFCAICPAGGDGDNLPIAVDCQQKETVFIDNCVSMGCDLACNKTCSDECQASDEQDDCVVCPAATPPAQEPDTEDPPPIVGIVFDATTQESCESTNSTLVCTQEARIALPDETSYSNVSMTVECNVDSSLSFLNFRQAQLETSNCTCAVNVTRQDGQVATNCGCNVCPGGFGPQPIGIICSKEDKAVGDCDRVDCNGQCEGTCFFGCENGAGSECPLCIEPTPTCYDLDTFETPLTMGESTKTYYGIKFNLQAKKPLELIGLEIAARMSELNDTYIAVYYNEAGYDSGSAFVKVAGIEASQAGTRLVLSPGESFTPVPFEADQIIGFYIGMQGPWLEANLENEGVEGPDLVMEKGYGVISISPDEYDSGTTPYFAGKFLYRDAGSCTDCPLCPTFLDLNSTADECRTTEDHFICNRQTRVTSPDNSDEYSELDLEVQCDLPPPELDNFRGGTNCSCSVEVKDHFGGTRNCECSVCTDGFGENDIAIHCQEDFVVGQCSSIDCNSECNGVCSSSCVESGTECSLCSSTSTPDTSTSATEPPTAAPQTFAPTIAEDTYYYFDLSVRLKGGKELSPESKEAFNNVTGKSRVMHARVLSTQASLFDLFSRASVINSSPSKMSQPISTWRTLARQPRLVADYKMWLLLRLIQRSEQKTKTLTRLATQSSTTSLLNSPRSGMLLPKIKVATFSSSI